jgi:hypothetical protein
MNEMMGVKTKEDKKTEDHSQHTGMDMKEEKPSKGYLTIF